MTIEGLAAYLENGEGPTGAEVIRQTLAAEATWVELPPELEDDIVSAIKMGMPQAPANTGGAARWWTGIAAAVVAVVVGLSSLIGAGSHRVNLVATDLAVGATAYAIVTPTPSGIHVLLDVEGLDPAPTGFYYQGWLKKGDELLTIGTFHMRGGDGRVDLWAGGSLGEYELLTVTLQQDGAGQDSSGKVFLRGELPNG